jgi:hypothetical protein
MINQGKCPKCGNVIREVATEAITVGQYPCKQWQGMSCLCPSCKTVLSVEIDPIALAIDISNEVVKKISRV